MVPAIPVLGIVLCLLLMLSLPVLTWMRFYGWLRIGLVIYLGYGLANSALVSSAHERSTARWVSASTAATLGLAGLFLDSLIALVVVFRHPEFIQTGEFLAFALLLVFCNLVHSWLAVKRATTQTTKMLGFILAGLSVAGFLALILV